MAFDAGVVVIALQGVFDEEDVLKQGEQSLADLVFIGTATIFAFEKIIDSALGGELRSEVPNVIVRMREEGAAHPVCAFAEQAFEQGIIDEGTGQEVAIERKPCGFDLAHSIGHGRHKAPEESAHTVGGNFPNAEKAQDVVDAVGREMFGHLDISALPPRITVSGHGLPVVRGKAPVLPREREGIGWCTCRTAEIEIMRFRPRFDRTTGDADGNIPLEHHPTPPRMGSDITELRVQKILDVAIIIVGFSIGAVRSEGFGHGLRVIGTMLRPRAEIGRTKLVAQGRESGVSR